MAGDDLRELMRHFPAGVAVVTVDLEGERIGLTVGSLVALSLDPPLVGFALGREAALLELLRRAGTFGVSLLGEGQARLAAHFARGVPPIALWVGIETRAAEVGGPRLDGALGWMECRTRSEVEVGDHAFIVGDVVRAEPGPAARGLVYLGRRYEAS